MVESAVQDWSYLISGLGDRIFITCWVVILLSINISYGGFQIALKKQTICIYLLMWLGIMYCWPKCISNFATLISGSLKVI